MTGSARHGRSGWLAVPALGALLGCQDVGLPGRNTRVDEAAARPFRYQVYDVAPTTGAGEVVTEITPAAAPGAVATPRSQHWVRSGESVAIPDRLLRPVGGTGGSALYALAWDEPPYDRMYAAGEEPNMYHPLHRVPPVATRPEAGAAGEHGTGH